MPYTIAATTWTNLLDQLLGVVPGAAGGHRDRGEEADDDERDTAPTKADVGCVSSIDLQLD